MVLVVPVGSTGVRGDYVKYREMNKGIAYVWNWVLQKDYVWLDPSRMVRRQPKVVRCSRRLNVSHVVI